MLFRGLARDKSAPSHWTTLRVGHVAASTHRRAANSRDRGLVSVPIRGRFFSDTDDVTGAQRVVVLGYGFWLRQYGGREEVLGENISINDAPHEIVGVAPAWLRFRAPGEATVGLKDAALNPIAAPPLDPPLPHAEPGGTSPRHQRAPARSRRRAMCVGPWD